MTGRGAALLLLAALLAALPASRAPADATAQTPPTGSATSTPPPAPTTSTLRQLIEQPDRVVVRRRHTLPEIGLEGGARLEVSAVGAFEPGYEEQRVLGLRVELKHAGLSGDQGVFYLDVHEVEGLLHAISMLQQVAANQQQGLTTEAAFHTLEGFGVGLVLRNGKPSYYVEAIPAANAERVQVGLSPEAFLRLREEVDEARHRLFE